MNYNKLAHWRTPFFTVFATLLFWSSFSLIAQDNVDLNKGLIGHYTFESGADDQSSNGNDGDVNGPNLETGIGDDGDCYRWNDEDDFVVLPIDMNVGAMPQVTLSAWVFVKSYNSTVTIISNDDRGGDRKIFTTTIDKKKVWVISDGKGGFIGKTPVIRRNWVFLAATYDADSKTGTIYVDGVKTTGKTQMDMGANQIYIGANPYENANNDFEALIDEVRIYDRILSSTEIAAIRNLHDIPFAAKKVKKVESYFYMAKQDNLIVHAKMDVKSKTLGNVNKKDTLLGEPTKAKDVTYAEWLAIPIDGKTGYVQLKYLNKTTKGKTPNSELNQTLKKYTDLSSWQFWVFTLVVLLISYGASMKFHVVDGWLNGFTQNDFEGNLAFFPVFTGLSGVVFAILMVIWQDQIEYFLTENFTLWPSGYGFAAWAVWVLLLANTAIFGLLLNESLLCGNIIHGIVRVIIQGVLGVFTFISSMIITIALIIIILGILIIGIAVSALFYRRVYTDMWGNKYVEDY